MADGKSGQPAQAKAQDTGGSSKKKELASSDDSMGFGGDVAETTGDNKKFQSTLPVKTSQVKAAAVSAQNGSLTGAANIGGGTKHKIGSKYRLRDIPAFNSGPALAMALGDEKTLPALKAAEISNKTKLATSMGTNESNSQQAFAEIKRILKHIDETINRRLPGDNF